MTDALETTQVDIDLAGDRVGGGAGPVVEVALGQARSDAGDGIALHRILGGHVLGYRTQVASVVDEADRSRGGRAGGHGGTAGSHGGTCPRASQRSHCRWPDGGSHDDGECQLATGT
ncbi:hypothetical protein D9M73_292440 [compost metagenome]